MSMNRERRPCPFRGMNILSVDLDIGFRSNITNLSAHPRCLTHRRQTSKRPISCPSKKWPEQLDKMAACSSPPVSCTCRTARCAGRVEGVRWIFFKVKLDQRHPPAGSTIDSTRVLGPTNWLIGSRCALRRHPGIEYEGAPADPTVQRWPLVGFQRLLKVPLSDEAPRVTGFRRTNRG